MLEYLESHNEQIQKEIDCIKDSIRIEESINKDSEELSFLYYQLHELEKLKESKGEKNGKRN